MRFLKNEIRVGLVFTLLFVGDYLVISLPFLLFLSILSLLAYIFSNQKKEIHLSGTVFVLFLFLLCFSFIDFIRFLNDGSGIEITRMVVNLSLVVSLPYVFSTNIGSMKSLLIPMLVGLLVIGNLVTLGRDFIFGPNIMYRQVLFAALILPGWLAVILMIFGNIATQSRGAFLSSGLFLMTKYRWTIQLGVIVSVFLILITVLVLGGSSDLPRFMRIYDSDSSNSISDRYLVLSSLSYKTLIWGIDNSAVLKDFGFIKYPHNSVVEFIWWYGIIGFLFASYLFYVFFVKYFSRFSLTLFVVFIFPTLLSGGYLDNAAPVIYSIVWLISNGNSQRHNRVT